jgi:glycerate kinase
MTVIVAPDSFKGNLCASSAAACIEAGVLRAYKKAKVYKIPLADGGEGTARALTEALGGEFRVFFVKGPLGKRVKAKIGLIQKGAVAVIDAASASGIELLKREELNPMKASSFGTGELIKGALDCGVKEIIIGIGGSATNDGGIGMLSALGFEILDEMDVPVGQGGEALKKIASFNPSNADKRLKNVLIRVACDVNNPLFGPNGASRVFGPQKGATPEMVKSLEAGLKRLWKAWIKAGLTGGVEQKGDGAAGGLGAALRICLGAKMESGAMLVMRHAGFFSKLKNADLVITGECMTDSQTAGGKLCSVVARESRRAGVPVALLSGSLSGDVPSLLTMFDYAASVSQGQTSLDAMIKDSKRDLSLAAENLIRAINIGSKMK